MVFIVVTVWFVSNLLFFVTSRISVVFVRHNSTFFEVWLEAVTFLLVILISWLQLLSCKLAEIKFRYKSLCEVRRVNIASR